MRKDNGVLEALKFLPNYDEYFANFEDDLKDSKLSGW